MRSMRASIPLLALTLLSPLPAAASEIAAAHLVFEKGVKMKKLDATLYVPYDEVGDRLRCGVQARGRGGRLAASGSFRLRLVGHLEDGSETWAGEVASAEVDAGGEAGFDTGEIARLTSRALLAEAVVSYYRIDFAGGRGGRVAELTLDCLRDRVDE